MYLRRLELKGFKSFADKTMVEFKDGITCIVGPNGSGKSNVTDSIRWVLGEQKVRLLRGSKMEDVIFNGTKTRKSVGLAEVSLIFDNADHLLNIDYDEVKITRRVHRSGENEYLINDNQCRLKDVRELFMDTGIGTEGYSVIGQGRIDSVLSSNDEDRRHIFEEASGIAKFRARKKETERKLESTEFNLMRIGDIAGETEERCIRLEKEAGKARLYEQYNEELKSLEIRVLTENLEKAEAKRQFAKIKIDGIAESLKKLEDDHKKTECEYEAVTSEPQRLRESRMLLDEKVGKILETIKEKEDQQTLYSLKIDASYDTKIENKKFLESCKELSNNLETEIKKNKELIENFESEYKKYEDDLSKMEIEALELENKVNIFLEETGKNQGDQINKSALLERLKANLSSSEEKVKDLKVRLRETDIKIDNLVESVDENQKKLSAIRPELEGLYEKKAMLSNDISSRDEEIKILSNDLEELTLKRRLKDSLLHKNEAELDMLASLESSHEGYDFAVRVIREFVENTSAPIDVKNGYVGIIAELIDVPDKYVNAVEAVLGRQLQNVVTDDESVAKALIERLKSVKGGRATFLPVSTVKQQSRMNVNQTVVNVSGYIGIASEIVKIESRYKNILLHLLGRVILVDDFDSAAAIIRFLDGGYRVVTVQGEVINSSGAITGGYIGKKRSGILSRKAGANQLQRENKNLRTEIDDIKKQVDTINIRINDIERSVRDLKPPLSDVDGAIQSSQNGKLRAEESIKHILATLGELKGDRQSIKMELDKNKSNVLIFTKEVAEMEKQVEQIDVEADKAIFFLKNARDGLTSINRKITDIKIDIASKREKTDSERERLKGNIEKLRDLSESELMSQKALAKNDKEKELYAGELEKLNGILEELRVQKEKVYLELEENKELMFQSEISVKELYANMRVLDEAMNEHKNNIFKNEVLIGGIDGEINGIENIIFEKYCFSIDEAKNYVSNLEKVEISHTTRIKRVKELKEIMKSMGIVNLDAPREFEEVMERRNFMSEQISDLQEAKRDLERILKQLEREMKKKFVQVFDEININFKEVFSKLFTGGTAGIELKDPGDVLDSSIEIHAQPPGKKLQSLSLLSGGERSLTAIALVFSIMKIKSPPFCILDEIDAALDDINVNRFARFIEEYAEKSQFIIITHRRGTMESADALYGITMEEMGISRLLSLKPEQARKI